MNKLTPLQLFTLMICGRAFSMMTYFPFIHDNTQVIMLGMVISTVIQGILVLPIIYLHKKFPGDCVCTLALSKNRVLGVCITGIYMLLFLIVSFFIIGNFAYFLDYFFADYIPRIMIVLCCTLAAIYLAHMNTWVIGKTSIVTAALFVLFTVVIVLGSFQKFSFNNFHLAVDNFPHSLWEAVKSEFVLNWDLVLFIFLLPDLKGSATKTASWYLITKLVISEVILTFITMILGDYGTITKLSFFSLSAYSHTQFIERYDAAFMSLWVIIALVKLSVYIHCAGRCVKLIAPKVKFVPSVTICGLLPAAASLFLLIPHKWKNAAYFEGGMWLQIALYSLMPLLILLFVKKGGYKIKEGAGNSEGT